MIEFSGILVLIDTVATFFQGFSFRRRHIPILVVSSLIMISVTVLTMILEGIGVYVDTISNADAYEVVASLAYVLFWWGSGYVIGGLRRRKKEAL